MIISQGLQPNHSEWMRLLAELHDEKLLSRSELRHCDLLLGLLREHGRFRRLGISVGEIFTGTHILVVPAV